MYGVFGGVYVVSVEVSDGKKSVVARGLERDKVTRCKLGVGQ